MKYNILKRFFALTAGAFIIIFTLLYCDRRHESYGQTSFARKYTPQPLKPVTSIELDIDPGQLLDITGTDTFLVSSRDSKKLYWMDMKQNRKVEYAPVNLKSEYERITAAWYSNNCLYVYNANGKTLLTQPGFPNGPATDSIQTVKYNVTKATPWINNQVLLRKSDTVGKGCRMAILDATNNTVKQDNWSKKEINNDCLNTDGSFAFDSHNNIFHVNYYNSRILRFDSSLKTVTEYATIDNRKSLPAVKFDSATKTNNFYAPHRIVNAFAVAGNNRLFVFSAETADNDLNSVIRNNAPIDMYSTESGTYIASYMLENVKINDILDVKMKGSQMCVLLRNKKLFVYQIN